MTAGFAELSCNSAAFLLNGQRPPSFWKAKLCATGSKPVLTQEGSAGITVAALNERRNSGGHRPPLQLSGLMRDLQRRCVTVLVELQLADQCSAPSPQSLGGAWASSGAGERARSMLHQPDIADQVGA